MTINAETLRQRLFDMNVAGWRSQAEHHPACDGTCSDCPIQVQIQISPDEIVEAILDLDVPPGYAYTPATPAHHNCMIEGGGQRDK